MRSSPSLTLVALALTCWGGDAGLENQMARAHTPYLARAQGQPVEWQGWSRETFQLASRLDRPILLAVGAGSCRACWLMDRETYGDPSIAGLIDSLFVPVRVDADERPDLAQRYETAVDLLTGVHGYPLTAFLTPEGSAFFGGTYFPPDDPVTGRGMMQVLLDVAHSFHAQHAFVLRQAALVHRLGYTRGEGAHGVLGAGLLVRGVHGVRTALALALRERAGLETLAAAEGVALLLEAGPGLGNPVDSSDLDVARAALDVDADSVAAPDADERRGPERGAVLSALTLGWERTGDPRYRDAARLELATLMGETAARGRVAFTDHEAYVAGALLEAGLAFADTAALRVAQGLLDTVLARAYLPSQGAKHLTAPGVGVPLLLQDQVELAAACLAAARATADLRYRRIAEDLVAVVEREFADPAGGYFDAARADSVTPALGERTKQVLDDGLPGANAAAARVLLELGRATHEPRYRQRAEATLEAFAGLIPRAGLRGATYLRAARAVLSPR